MALQTHLQRRGGRYRVRVRAPRDLIAIVGRNEIVRALNTSDPQVARMQGARVSALIHQLFARLRNPMLPYEEKRAIARAFYEEDLRKDENLRVQAGWLEHARAALDLSRLSRPDLEAALREHSAVGEKALITWAADDVIVRQDLAIERGSHEYHELCLTLTRAWLEATRRKRERDQGDWGGEPSDPLVAALTPAQPAIVADPSTPAVPERTYAISEVHERYLAERKDIAEHTRTENRQYVAWFEQFFGNKLLHSIRKKDVIGWKDALLRFPAQATKMFPGKNFPEILKLNERRGAKTIANKTIEKYLSALRAFFEWCVRNDYLNENVARGVGVPVSKCKKARDGYTVAQLQELFRSPLFVGCRSGDDQEVHVPGEHHVRDHRYWAPLLALYTGARMGELLQLLVEDVKQRDGILYLNIVAVDDDSKSLKTDSSRRMVPLHPELVRLGFLEYVEGCRRAAQLRLFPGAEVNGFSKFYNARYLTRIGLKTKRLCFHSFRHGFLTAARDAGVGESMMKALVGHADASVTSGYGEFSLKARHEAICRVGYGDLSLEHLYLERSKRVVGRERTACRSAR